VLVFQCWTSPCSSAPCVRKRKIESRPGGRSGAAIAGSLGSALTDDLTAEAVVIENVPDRIGGVVTAPHGIEGEDEDAAPSGQARSYVVSSSNSDLIGVFYSSVHWKLLAAGQ